MRRSPTGTSENLHLCVTNGQILHSIVMHWLQERQFTWILLFHFYMTTFDLIKQVMHCSAGAFTDSGDAAFRTRRICLPALIAHGCWRRIMRVPKLEVCRWDACFVASCLPIGILERQQGKLAMFAPQTPQVNNAFHTAHRWLTNPCG
jgi:hypothetical protein